MYNKVRSQPLKFFFFVFFFYRKHKSYLKPLAVNQISVFQDTVTFAWEKKGIKAVVARQCMINVLMYDKLKLV